MVETANLELRLAQLDYPASDVETTLTFFRDILGMRVVLRAGPLAFCDLGGVRLYIRPAQNDADLARASILYLRSDDLDASLAILVDRGATVAETSHVIAEMDDHTLWMAFIDGPDGRRIGLMEERRRQS